MQNACWTTTYDATRPDPKLPVDAYTQPMCIVRHHLTSYLCCCPLPLLIPYLPLSPHQGVSPRSEADEELDGEHRDEEDEREPKVCISVCSGAGDRHANG